MILVTVSIPTPTSIRSAAYSWTVSSVAGEYYLRTALGANPALTEPDKILRNARYFTKGTIGALSAYEYGYGDGDSLGYDTIYIRLYDGSDPDGKVLDSISAIYYDDCRCSNEAIPLEHYWDPYAMSFGAIKYQIDQLHGGYCRLSYGSITFMPELFVNHWPPAPSLTIKAEYTEDTEATAITLFEGTIHLKSMTVDEIEYDIYNAEEYQINMLTESITNDSDQVDIRNANYKWTQHGATSTYFLELAAGGDPALPLPDAVLANYSTLAYNDEMGILGLAVSEWGYGDVGSLGYNTIYVRLSDSTDPDTKGGAWLLAVYGIYALPMAFGSVTYVPIVRLIDATAGGNQRYWLADVQGTVGVDWFLYDDGVDVSANVTNVSGNVFELTVTPVGALSISGAGSCTTLLSAFQWAVDTTRLNLTLVHTYDRATSPSINFYLTDQRYIPDFLSDMAAYFTHLFYTRTGSLYLVDMLISAGTETTTEFDFFESGYTYNAPAKLIKSSYQYRIAGEWYDGLGGSSGVCVRESTRVVSIPSSYPYGDAAQEFSPPYCEGLTPIKSALGNILTIIERPQVAISVPFGLTLQSPGKKISWLNESFPYDVNSNVWVRTVTYDFDNNEIGIEGDCEVTA
jgi:hypothetical protein